MRAPHLRLLLILALLLALIPACGGRRGGGGGGGDDDDSADDDDAIDDDDATADDDDVLDDDDATADDDDVLDDDDATFDDDDATGADNDGDGWPEDVDCNDFDPDINPGENEACNGEDDDCDGSVDEDFDQDVDGWTTCAGDCEDLDPYAYPGATESCDGVDNDCDGLTDEDFLDFANDQDQDGVPGCIDCDDFDPAVFPGATEECSDGDDNDCNFDTDCFDDACAPPSNTAPTVDAGFAVVVAGEATCTSDVYSGYSCGDCEWFNSPATGDGVALDGSGSFDAQNNVASWLWTNTTQLTDGFIANDSLQVTWFETSMSGTTLGTVSATEVFQLTAVDCNGLTDSDTVTITFECNFHL